MLKIYPVETKKDVENARELFREYAEFLKEELYEYKDLPWLVQYYQDFEKEVENLPKRYQQPKGCILIGRYNEQPIGCVALTEQSENICEMKRLYVKPEYRRKGIGTALCKAVMEQAKKAGYTHMRLGTALEVPKALYNSLGFKTIAPYEEVPVEGVVFMELKLV